MTDTTKTLDLAKVFTRDDVKMPDGTTLELRNKAEFSIVDDHKLRALIERITAMDDAPKTEEDAVKASQMLRDLATMLIVDPPAEIEDWVCVAVFEFWIERAEGEAPENPPRRRPQDRKRSTRKRTTAASSRASKRSTAATRKTGSRKSRPGR